MNAIENLAVNSIRILSADAIQKANSGHPGLPLGCAAAAYELWAHHMNHNPANPSWANRDRFILSGGHGSMLLYSLLHLFGYGLTKEDLMNFRQLGSLTPGHPEYGHTVGVEATTGPLGAGMGMAVGMAIAEKHLASVFNKENYPVVDHYTFVLGGDGCMMEGISSEAFSLAGTLGLGKLIVLYDSNQISIEGSTDIAFRENVQERMKAFGFQTITVEDGNNISAIGMAIEAAKAETERPSFITIKTQIGYGCPAKQGKASAHGEPLGEENVKALRENLGWPYEEPFFVPQEVYEHYSRLAEEKGTNRSNLVNQILAEYLSMTTPEKHVQNIFDIIERFIGILIEHFAGAFPTWLAPVQVRVLPISEKYMDYAKNVEKKLQDAGIRTELDERSEKIGYKIREAQTAKIPYMLVVGQKEEEEGTVSVRTRAGGDQGAKSLDEFTADILKEIEEKVRQ